MYKLTVTELGKRFGDRKVFKDISLELATGQSLAIVGPNGSGKSTLLGLLLGILHPTKGKIEFSRNGEPLEESDLRDSTALVSPYLSLYDQLTGEENLLFLATLSGQNITGKEIDSLLDRVGLEGRGMDRVAAYSSGMKQRLKYAAALMKDPQYLFLDEPTSNLDESGKKIVRSLIRERRDRSIIVIATNEPEEYEMADGTFRISQ